MAFDLEAGEHTIQMHYVPEGRNIGILVSAGSVLILLGYVLYQRCDRKRKDCAENEPSQKAADENNGKRECGENAHRGRFCEGRGRKDVRRSEL